jgi:oligoribonuclease NrnB/cAMP/cGMP phosphodiesterase (DHH superfamily)
MTSCFSKPDVILTHESDLDGLVAGVLLRRLAKRLFGADVRLEAWNYNYWRQRELRESAAWVTDLTFEARLDRPNWVVVDHHVTDTPAKNVTLIHDLNKSAGLLCYELCKEQGLGSPALDRLVHLNNVADLFLEDDPDFELASDYANLVKIYQFWNLHALLEGEIERLLDHPLLEVMAVKRRVENPLGFAWSKENIKEISPTIGYVDTVIGNNNLIVHQLLEEQATHFPVLITLFRRTNGAVIASLRSRNGEALKVAEKLQGGGHANASAATLPRSVRNIPDAVNYLRQVFNPKKDAGLNSLEGLFASVEATTRSTESRP